ncbi:MAG: hypothetical protein ACJAWV_003905 [Flammeovirgaceae bacterium]
MFGTGSDWGRNRQPAPAFRLMQASSLASRISKFYNSRNLDNDALEPSVYFYKDLFCWKSGFDKNVFLSLFFANSDKNYREII